MAISLLESLRRLIRQDSSRIGGPIGNLHGTVISSLEALASGVPQSWMIMEVYGSLLPDLEGFYQNYGVMGGTMSEQLAVNGVADCRASLPGTIQLIRTTATIRQRTTFTLRTTVTVPSGECSVYVDGVLIRRGQGTTAIPITLDAGTHDIAVVSNAMSTLIEVPSTIELDGATDQPGKPSWVAVATDYLDPAVGSAQNTLTWVSDPRVGGYYVLRRSLIELQSREEGAAVDDGTLLRVGDTNEDGSYVVVIKGEHAEEIVVGAEVLADFDSLGIVVGTLGDADGDTTILCRRVPGTTRANSDWLGRYCFLGTFSPITQVTRTTNAPTIEYVDSAVTFGQAYQYALIAYGLVNPAIRSIRSDIQYVVAGDIFPPGSIVFSEGYPTIDSGFVTARFTTPSDRDYSGVNVYWHQRVQNEEALDQFVDYTVAAVSGRIVTVNDPELPVGELVGYTAVFPDGLSYEIVANTQGTFTIERDFLPAITVGDSISIFKATKIKTDYGLPSTLDELSFLATDVGRYYFCTFDRAGNEQSYLVAAYYDLTDLGTGAGAFPIVSFRQLVSGEQNFFPDPFKDTTQYAIVEMYAYNAGVSAAQKFNGVELWYRRRGDNSDRLITPIPFSGQAFPYVVSGSAQAILDAPNWVTTPPYPPVVSGGVLSRYVSLARSQADNWIRVWAENADGLATDTLTFVVDFDTTPEITSLETTIDNVGNTASFEAIIDDDTQGFRWYVVPNAANEPSQTNPGHIGSATLKKLGATGEIALALGESKRLVVTPFSQWSTVTATVTASSTNTITFGAASFAVNSLAGRWATYTVASATYNYRILSNTATTITFARSSGTLPTNGTQVVIGQATGAEGEPVERQLVRTPRSFVSFENKNERGERDVTKVTATFTMAPTPKALTTTNFTATISGATLTASGVTWSAAAFIQSNTAYAYCRVIKNIVDPITLQVTGTKTEMRRVVSTGTTTLQVVNGSFSNEVQGSVTATIFDGAVLVRKRVDPAQTNSEGFVPTVGQETYSRSETFYLDYYATSNGCLPENVRTVLVDPDTIASLQGFTMTYASSTSKLTAYATGTDDDAKYWVLFIKRGSWPVEGSLATPPASGTALSTEIAKQPDERFCRYISNDVQGSSLTFTMTVENVAGTWYAIGIPYNSFGQEGARAYASATISGVVGQDPDALLTAAATFTPTTTQAPVTVTAQSGATGAGFTVTAYDSAAPTTTYTATGTFGSVGTGGTVAGTATISNLPFTVSSTATSNTRQMTFTVSSGGRTPISTTGTYFAVVGGSVGGSTPTLSFAAENPVLLWDEGYCDDSCDQQNFRPMQWRVRVVTANTTTLLHRVYLEICDNYNDVYAPAVWDTVPTNGTETIYYSPMCQVYRGAGTLSPIKFRATIIRIDTGDIVATAVSAVVPTKVYICGGRL